MSNRYLSTSDGTHDGHFGPTEWAMLAFNSVVWGSSFLLIAISIEALTPGMVAWARLILSGGFLALMPAARRKIEREDWRPLAVIAVVGNAGPALFFAFAEQTVPSSIAGMLTSAVPILTAVIAFALGIRSMGARHVVGLVGGFLGVTLIGIPSLTGERPAVLGVVLILLAVTGYAVVNNLVVPLAQKYGGLPITMWAASAGALLLTPFGVWDVRANEWELRSVLALVALGVLSTGVARVVQANLAGRVGGPRASVIGYLLPTVALIVGVAFNDETVGSLEIGGLALVLLSAYLVSRATRTT
ncbi:MAG: EamA family transporter [Acidimicrobiia bacterium]|nr:MAG: EamA family transporter [Acidimicrobiia bacterium]